MRIISDFKDYYDSIQAYGYDPNDVLYVRKRKIIDLHDEHNSPLEHKIQNFSTEYSGNIYFPLYRASIAFCGKYYGFFYTYGERDSKGASTLVWFTSVEAVTDYFGKETPKTFNNKRSQEHFVTANQSTFDYLPLHTKYNSPVLMTMDKQFIVNPCLANTGLVKIMNAFNTYQSIDMYISNQMARQPDPIPTRTNELIRDSKGFDNQSFKTLSPGKKHKKAWWK